MPANTASRAGGSPYRSLPAGEGAGPSFAVRDYGPGIAEEHIPRLTERFYRIDVDASRKHRGTGLGLAIVKHILARHHARMTIDSRLGEGATFTVTFPPGASRDPTGLGREIRSRSQWVKSVVKLSSRRHRTIIRGD